MRRDLCAEGRPERPRCETQRPPAVVLGIKSAAVAATVNHTRAEMRVGDVMSIPAGAVHSQRNLGTETQFSPSVCSADRYGVGYQPSLYLRLRSTDDSRGAHRA